VEQVAGTADLGACRIRLVDVPGTYSLAANSPDEMIAVDVLTGAVPEIGTPDAVVLVVDATNLRRNLFLASQVLEAGLPTVIALNMADRLAREGIALDPVELERRLGVPVVPLSAARGDGLPALRATLAMLLTSAAPPPRPAIMGTAFETAVTALAAACGLEAKGAAALPLRRALIDSGGYAEARLIERHGDAARTMLESLRAEVGGGRNLATLEARDRYSWIQARLAGIEQRGTNADKQRADALDRVLNHPLGGTCLFALIMALVFQAVFAWATPLVDAIDYLSGALAASIGAALGPGLFTSFVTDGVIAGVGSVVVFLPQILILFAFIIVLEDTGYMARAAFLMDRLMRTLGLSGQSFIPMLSSFACAVPGIMGTRVIANRHDRLATIMAAPFMTCSARLPVYSLLISAFVPDTRYAGRGSCCSVCTASASLAEQRRRG
jgi:ferrous iron transport protein B